MKNKIIITIFLYFYFTNIFADSLNIQANSITLDKDGMTSIFKDDVIIKSKESTIRSNYAKYNKKEGSILIKENILAEDEKGNLIQADIAEYFENNKTLKTKGKTKITTTDKYILEGNDIKIDGQNKYITSEKNSLLRNVYFES